MPERPVVHDTFQIERTYKQPPARVFRAFEDPVMKRRWFAEGEDWELESFTVDFRVGGVESARFRFHGGPPVENQTVYQDIVPNQRIIIAYTMAVDGKRISSSLATMEFLADGSGTRLVYTEQDAFLDGTDSVDGRREGCRGLLERLAKELDANA